MAWMHMRYQAEKEMFLEKERESREEEKVRVPLSLGNMFDNLLPQSNQNHMFAIFRFWAISELMSQICSKHIPECCNLFYMSPCCWQSWSHVKPSGAIESYMYFMEWKKFGVCSSWRENIQLLIHWLWTHRLLQRNTKPEPYHRRRPRHHRQDRADELRRRSHDRLRQHRKRHRHFVSVYYCASEMVVVRCSCTWYMNRGFASLCIGEVPMGVHLHKELLSYREIPVRSQFCSLGHPPHTLKKSTSALCDYSCF